jgi:hypothetical protein
MTMRPYEIQTYHHEFLGRFPSLWWLMVRVNGYESPSLIGNIVSNVTTPDPSYYVHPSSDRDIRILANSTAVLAKAANDQELPTWLAARIV